jgi:hypothetical protein
MASATVSLRRGVCMSSSPRTACQQKPRAAYHKLQHRGSVPCRAAQEDERSSNLVGEDAAVFSVEEQTAEQWTRFFIVLGVVASVEVRAAISW